MVPVTRAVPEPVTGTGLFLLRPPALFQLSVPVADSLFPLRKIPRIPCVLLQVI